MLEEKIVKLKILKVKMKDELGKMKIELLMDNNVTNILAIANDELQITLVVCLNF